MNNKKIRIAMIESGIKQYQLAQILGKHEGSVSRMLREEMPEAEQDRIVRLIKEEAEKNGQE